MSQRRKLGKYTVQLAGIYTMSLYRESLQRVTRRVVVKTSNSGRAA